MKLSAASKLDNARGEALEIEFVRRFGPETATSHRNIRRRRRRYKERMEW